MAKSKIFRTVILMGLIACMLSVGLCAYAGITDDYDNQTVHCYTGTNTEDVFKIHNYFDTAASGYFYNHYTNCQHDNGLLTDITLEFKLYVLNTAKSDPYELEIGESWNFNNWALKDDDCHLSLWNANWPVVDTRVSGMWSPDAM